MIITKKVSVKLNSKNIKNLIEFGYSGNINDIIEIDIIHLALNSKIKVDVNCFYCDEINNVIYANYNKKKEYCCKKCMYDKIKKTNLEKYGVEYSSQSDIIKNKIKQTNLEKYGVENIFQSGVIKEKIKKTNLEKYGVENYTKTDEYKIKTKETKLLRYNNENFNNIEKISETNLEKYGYNTFMKTEKFLSIKKEIHLTNRELINNKIKKTNLEKYGVENTFQSDVIKDKIRKINLEKYGYEYPSQSDIIKNKIKETNLVKYGVDNPSKSKLILSNKSINNNNKFIDKYDNIISINEKVITINCNDHGPFEIEKSLFFNRIRLDTIVCVKCHPINSYSLSGKEVKLLNFIKENYKGEIIQSDRTILNGKELDIYLPELNLAFEFNGLYWHSELYKERMYHLNKTKDCSNKGINLIHIWEDDWNYKKEIVKSIILNKLGDSKRIFARKCEVKIPDNKEVRDFLDINHIQGFVGSKVKIGLYFEGELVSLITFGNLRKSLGQKSSENTYELLRFCDKLEYSVVGGAGKMFNYFLNNYDVNEVISYSDNSRGVGNLYKQLGFELVSETTPNYYWIVDGIRKHRFNFKKDKLIKEGNDPKKTEVQIMNDKGYNRIFDCGSKKWNYNFISI